MAENLYGGISYPNTSFTFDKVCNSYSEAAATVASDGVLIGRYILVAYCNSALSQDDRNTIETRATGGHGVIATWSQDWKDYFNNFIKDSKKSYDRHVFRKIYKDSTYYYEDIASLNSTLSMEGLAIHNVKFGDNILSIDENKNLTTTLGLRYDDNGGKLELIGIDNEIIAEVNTSDFIADSIFTDIEFNDNNNTITFYWKVYDIETNTYEPKSKVINMYDIIDPYIAGNGINVSTIPNENPIISIKLDTNTEKYLTVGSNGLKLFGIDNAIQTAMSWQPFVK